MATFAVRKSWLVVAGLAFCIGASPLTVSGQPMAGLGERTVPSQAYDLSLAALASGDFQAALQIARGEYQGSIQVGGQRWIDSIAAATLLGECHYEFGSLRDAVAAYEDAMLLATTHGDWLLAVQFPNQRLRPLGRGRVATWGKSIRGTMPAAIPDTMSIRQGGGDPAQVLKQGGVLTQPVNFPVRPQEIMRALVIAIYRHGCLMGELAGETRALADLQQVLGKRLAPVNHFSQSWIDVALGMALWAQGRKDEAIARFKNGLLVENQFDHPLTAWGLIGMGRIALDVGRDAEAAQLFEEATYTAADFGDARALEEAFQWAHTAHMAAGSRGVAPSISGAAAWSAASLPVLHSRLLAMQAEGLAVAGEQQAAVKVLASIDGRMLRGDPGRGLFGIDAAYAAATVAYRGGEIDLGDRELIRAVSMRQSREPRLYRLSRLVELVRAGSSTLADRRAHELFQAMLGDPPPRAFSVDPVGTLAAITAPRQESFETWIEVAARRSLEDGLAAAEATLRARWLEGQPWGGRRTAIETLLGTPPENLAPADAERRGALLARQPQLAAVVDGMSRVTGMLREDIRNAAVDRPAAVPPRDGRWQEYQRLAGARSASVAALAGGRDPTAIGFPPLVPPPEIRRRLKPGEFILSFHWTASRLTGVLESRDTRTAWEVKQPGTLAREIAGLARALCLFEATAAVPTERLVSGEWQLAAERVERLLFKDARINLADDAVEELAIVPDGLLWYVPFEILPVGTGRDGAVPAEEPRRLRDACRIRYCPTRSLAVDRFPADRRDGLIGVHVGRMHRGDTPEAARQLVERLSTSLDEPVVLASSSERPLAVAAALVDTLVIFDEISGDMAANRALVPAVQGRPGLTFSEWVASPRKRPWLVVLPGYQSAMSSGLARLPSRPGEDMFQAATDLLAAGARTAVVSRWRMGGLSGVHLVEEFVRDATLARDTGGPSASADAWHRAVDIVAAEEPDIAREPRLSQAADAVLSDGRHPLFWSGYMLIDCGTGDRPDAPVAAAPAARAVPPPPAVRPAPQAAP
jgi:tetratricopeptide (TPR) repeat protein